MSREDIMIKEHQSKLNGMLSSFNTIVLGGFESETKYISSKGYDSKLVGINTIMRVKSTTESNHSVVYEIITEYFSSSIVTTIKEKSEDYNGNEYSTRYENFR